MTDNALEAARQAIRYLSHPETPWSDEQVQAVISAYLSVLPGEAEVDHHIERCKEIADDGDGGTYQWWSRLAEILASLQARAEIAERERDAFRDMADGYGKLDAELAIAEARVKELEEALKPFATHLVEMKFDLDSHGNELPDEQTVGWVYVTNGDFRRARTALKGDKP